MASYLIVGAGKFGRLALRRLVRVEAAARITVVDRDPQALAVFSALAPDATAVVADGPAFLAARLADLARWDYLLPCVPVHLAWETLCLGPLAPPRWEPAPVPGELKSLAPVAVAAPQGGLYLSRAAHRCPDDCGEPEICPVDGGSRVPPLSGLLAAWHLAGWGIRVLVTRLLAPGVGAFTPGELRALGEPAAALPDRLVIATACRCHAVVHGLRRQGEGNW